MKILVVIDMQNDFINGALGTPEAQAIVPSAIAKIKEYEDAGYRIIYTKDTHSEDYLKTAEGINLPVEHCIKGTHGHDIPEEILRSHSLIFEKPTFGSVELAAYLRKCYDKVQDKMEFELVGVCTDICVISNAMIIKGFCPETQVAVVSNCCAGVTAESHNNALNAMKMCQVRVEE